MSIVADCKVKGLSNPFKDSVFMATVTLGESTRAAVAAAEAWLAKQEPEMAATATAGAETTTEKENLKQSDNSVEEA